MAAKTFAPTYKVPPTEIVAAEHPCIVKNIGKGIAMLGGPKAIKHTLEAERSTTLGLKFHPGDPDSRTVQSFNNNTSNPLLQITVPKRVGKRKRGSSGPFQPLGAAETILDAQHLVRSLKDNEAKFVVEAAGSIVQNHVWRAMPDFAYSTAGSKFLADVKSKLLPHDLQSLKQFDMQRMYTGPTNEAIPPPVFSTVTLPQPYSYRQGSEVNREFDVETGQRTIKLQKMVQAKMHLHSVGEHDQSYPATPMSSMPQLEDQHVDVRELIPMLQNLFEERHMWTRRALINNLPDHASFERLRFSLGYVAFAIRAGPWRDCLCKLGVDPRTLPEYGKYQTIMLQTQKRNDDTGQGPQRFWGRSTDKTTHIFTGNSMKPGNGSQWQLCDIEDPSLRPLIDIDESFLATKCETTFFGWYHNGTISKIRCVIKAKLEALSKGEMLEDDVFDRFLTILPEQLDHYDSRHSRKGDLTNGQLPPPTTDLEERLCKHYRGLCRYVAGKESRKNKRATGKEAFDEDMPSPDGPHEEDAAYDEPLPNAQMEGEPDVAFVDYAAPPEPMHDLFAPRQIASGPFITLKHRAPFNATSTAIDSQRVHSGGVGYRRSVDQIEVEADMRSASGQLAFEDAWVAAESSSAPALPAFEQAWL